MGAIAAVIVYFARDIWSIIRAWALGLVKPEYRGHLDHRMGWYVIVGTIPVGDRRACWSRTSSPDDLRSCGWSAVALIGWSAVMWARRAGRPRRTAREQRPEPDATRSSIGLVQCVALIPGVSRSGATISAGLFRGLDRVTATRLVFFLSIPALLAAGLFELKDALGGDIGVGRDARRHRGRVRRRLRRRSPGCCGSSPTTRSRGSCPTGSALGALLIVLLATGVVSAT